MRDPKNNRGHDESEAFEDIDFIDWDDHERITMADITPDVPFNVFGEDDEICPMAGSRAEAHAFGPDDDDIPF